MINVRTLNTSFETELRIIQKLFIMANPNYFLELFLFYSKKPLTYFPLTFSN